MLVSTSKIPEITGYANPGVTAAIKISFYCSRGWTMAVMAVFLDLPIVLHSNLIVTLFCCCRGQGLVVMAEAERRLGKTPLLKQPEIEEAEEEEQSQSDEVLVNSSSSDACAGKNVCQDDRGLVELGKCGTAAQGN